MQILFILLVLFIQPIKSRVVISVFAGREKYLRILKKYLDVLISRNEINEVHIWDYTRNDKDRDYIFKLCEINNSYKLKTYNKTVITGYDISGGPWKFYYEYYLKTDEFDDEKDILIKCDDDIVFIDVNNFHRYISSIKNDGLYYQQMSAISRRASLVFIA